MSFCSDRRAFLRTTVTATAGASLPCWQGPLAYTVPGESKWISLFDGKSLDGWHKNRQKNQSWHGRHLVGRRWRNHG